MIESAAAANGLPCEFPARVIWQESRFRPDAVGPLTPHRLPGTSAERLLHKPFDPVQALPKRTLPSETETQIRNVRGRSARCARDYGRSAKTVLSRMRNLTQLLCPNSCQLALSFLMLVDVSRPTMRGHRCRPAVRCRPRRDSCRPAPRSIRAESCLDWQGDECSRWGYRSTRFRARCAHRCRP
jgi:hypothetical protein